MFHNFEREVGFFWGGVTPFGVWSVERVVVSGFVRDVSLAKSLGVWRGF